jgi:hypothetical protein
MAEGWQDSVNHVKEEGRLWFDNVGDQIMINIGEVTSSNEPESDSNLGGFYFL